MARRVRRQRSGVVRWSLALDMALTFGGRHAEAFSREELRSGWVFFGARYAGQRRPPWAFWQFTAGIPGDLREEPPAIYPVADAETHRAARADLEARRAAWLAEHARPSTPTAA